ncbi:MAG TPA: BrnT family toxin [Thermoanaerobaculia bacterium]
MRFEWDEAKRAANLQKHGIDFIGVDTLFAGYTVTMVDARFDYDEERFVTFGFLEGRVVTVVHTERADALRIISIRKATRSEESSYLSSIPD